MRTWAQTGVHLVMYRYSCGYKMVTLVTKHVETAVLLLHLSNKKLDLFY